MEPNSIQQGKLGDCYFLGILSSMAKNDEEIKDLFYTREINKAGCYMVYFYINGMRNSVIIDDFLPCFNGYPCYATSADS